jgi:hypothetical protein
LWNDGQDTLPDLKLFEKICFLRKKDASSMAILVALCCLEEDGTQRTYTVLMEQRQLSQGCGGAIMTMELPTGIISDDGIIVIKGPANKTMKQPEQQCGIYIHSSELIDLTELDAAASSMASGIISPPSSSRNDRLFYVEKKVTVADLESMRDNKIDASVFREHDDERDDESSTLPVHIVPLKDAWRMSGDFKVMW